MALAAKTAAPTRDIRNERIHLLMIPDIASPELHF